MPIHIFCPFDIEHVENFQTTQEDNSSGKITMSTATCTDDTVISIILYSGTDCSGSPTDVYIAKNGECTAFGSNDDDAYYKFRVCPK